VYKQLLFAGEIWKGIVEHRPRSDYGRTSISCQGQCVRAYWWYSSACGQLSWRL